jgi:DNA polymerase-3 subunit alpha
MQGKGKKRSSHIEPPKRFVGLHSHSGFSTYDGLGYPQEHIDFCLENEVDAWSLTDHGNMNGFGHAYFHAEKIKKSGSKFKFLPGCEMYVHPDLKQWRRELDDAKRAKEAAKEEVVNPLVAITDSNDETVDVTTEDAALTIENEDETKSSKLYNPINRRHHLVVLPKNSRGLEKLFHLVSQGYLDGFYRFPRIDYSVLREAGKDGDLIVSTACIGGPLAFDVLGQLQRVPFDQLDHNLLNDKSLMLKVMSQVSETYGKLVDAVGKNNVMLELQFNKLTAQHVVNRAIIEFAKNEGMTDQLVVTCDSHYARPEHWKEREIYKKLGWLNYEKFDPELLPKSKDDLKCELYPKNAGQVWETYLSTTAGMDFYEDQLVKEAIERTHDIAHEVIGNPQPDKSMKLPAYVVPEGMTDDKALLEASKKGLLKRGLADKPEYIDRLKHELKIIREKKFSRYFLTMRAIMEIASEEMLIGVARGSAGGSLVAYVLGITNIDPIEYGLIFERFLNPSRAGAPDIDTDISDRDKLIQLMRKKFGDHNVIPISNYNTFKLKSLVRDISRFYDIPLEEVNSALKVVEEDVKKETQKAGDDKNMFVLEYEDAVKHSPTFREFIDNHPEVTGAIEILFKQNKSLGRHAGGVIVSDYIAERMPLILARGEPQTPWVEGMNYKHLEELGWIKFDLLGLETLRMIERAIYLILQRRHGVENPTFLQIREWFENNMDPKVIDMNDQKVYKYVYHEGRFPGIFQLTSKGAQRMFMKAKPVNIIDIATLTSIYRPGPLAANVDKLYLEAKENSSKIDYGHPLIKQVLESTFGCIIFQEQIMKLCSVVAGFPESETDTIRRSIMKRTAAKMEESIATAKKLKDEFVTGSVKNGVPEKIADDLYEKILFFSGYGFNASHAVAYAIDSYFCAWLLTYYEEEWLCAYLEAMSISDEKRSAAFSEVRSMGYKIVPIDINYARKEWTIIEGKRFMPSFTSCKGVGDSAVEEIFKNRPYKSIEDLLWKDGGAWKHSKFNRRALESLIKIRAFDSLGCVGEGKVFDSYKQMHEVVIGRNDEIKKSTKKEPHKGMNSFKAITLETVGSGEWTKPEMVKNHVECFGYFDSSLILDQEIVDKLEAKGVRCIDTIDERDLYWFIVTGVSEKLTKNGKKYLLLNTVGMEGRSHRIFAWSWDGKLQVPLYSMCVAEVVKDDFGMKTFMNKFKIINT